MLAIRALRRIPNRSLSVRFTSSYSEGSVARSKEFGKKEKAHEDQFIKQHEAAQLKKLRDEINKKKEELEALEREHAKTLEKAQ